MTLIKYFKEEPYEKWVIPDKKVVIERGNMKVYILLWAGSNKIDSVYLDKKEAAYIADKANRKITWGHKLAGLFSGKLTKWIVVEYKVK